MSRGCGGWKPAATATHERENTRCIVALKDGLGEDQRRAQTHPSRLEFRGEGGKEKEAAVIF
jgi:hypothetical protein